MKGRLTRTIARVSLAVGIILAGLYVSGFGFPVVVAQSGTGTIRVAPTGTDASGCGSIASPCQTIQYAVNLAVSGDTIKVAQGTYTGSGTAAVVTIGNTSLTIIGGYTTSDWDTPSTDPTLTVIDGQNARRGFKVVPNTNTTLSIQGLTVQNGLGNDAIPVVGHFMGGGILCRNDNPSPTVFTDLTLSNVIVRNSLVQGTGNATAGGGGAAFYFHCRATLENATFDNNQVIGGNAAGGDLRGAYADGGGFIATGKSDIVATNLTLTNNSVQAGSGGAGQDAGGERADGLGGGAAMLDNVVTISGVTVTGNQATGGDGAQYGGHSAGAGLYFEKNTGPCTVTDGTLSGNVATGGASTSGGEGGVGGGGAIRTEGTTLQLERLTIINNSSLGGAGSDGGDAGGGALYFSRVPDPWGLPSVITGVNLVIADNVAEAGAGANRYGGGGGIFCQNTDLTLTHATIAGNSVLSTMAAPAIIVLHYDGSGIWGSRARLYYSIIANHTTASWGPAAMAQRSGDTLELNYTLFNGNASNYGAWPSPPPEWGTPTVSNNHEITPSGDPAFVSVGPPNYDYHIGGNSAARDRATGSTTALDIDKDSRPSGSAADVGADEYVPMNAELVLFKSYAPNNIAASSSPMVVPVLHKITLRNTGMGNTTSASLTDELSTPASPLGMTFATGPNCSSGTVCSYSPGTKTVSWSGNLDAGSAVTITYTTNVNVPAGYAETTMITTTTSYAYTDEEGGSGSGTIVPAFFINARLVYLPLVIKASG